MNIKKGDLVTRTSYQHDTIFKVLNIKDNVYYLKGVEMRIYANAPLDDLVKYEKEINKDDYLEKIKDKVLMDRGSFFYLPAKILHIDGDGEYLKRCLNFYKEAGVLAIGKRIKEDDISHNITSLIKEYHPDIIIITGHDAYYRKKGDVKNINNYKNSINFVKAVKEARKIEKSHDKLVIIAGACQSNYEELIKAGSNFASSPERVNIHALDPAIIAVSIALTEKKTPLDIIELLNKTKYKEAGMGGLKTDGLMYVGYPR